jgi:HlyD family secretion protein
LLWWFGFFLKEPFHGPTATVVRKKLQVTIVERGELASAKNCDIVCTVRARAQNTTVATTIKWLVDDGTEVKKGDKVIELDDSGLQEQLKQQNIVVEQAKAAWIKAEEQYRIDEIQAKTDIEKARNDRDLAKLDLEKFLEGDYIYSLKDVEGRIETARSDYEQWQDRAAWSLRMFKKGLVSKSQVDADEARREAARIALEKVLEERRVLVEYTKKRTIQDLTSKVEQAEQALEKAKIQARATLAKDDADRLAQKSTYEKELAKKHDLENEIAKCTLYAPQDGLVIYYVPEQARFGGGSQQSIVAQGEPVREGQKLMQIPDLTQMIVNVRVHEAMVSYLRSEDPEDKSSWQRALIRVNAFPSKILHGHVKSVDNTASQMDWFASDVKVYKTVVSIDESLEGLKPGMSAEVTIIADESPTPVLVIPVQSVLGTISMGAQRKCFVLGPDGQPQLRDIVVGMSNEREVEVKSGLKEGEQVVLDPRPLLPEDSDLRPGKVRTRQELEEGPSGGGEPKGGKRRNGRPGAPGATPKGTPAAPGFSGLDPQTLQRLQEQLLAELRPLTPEQRRDRINQRVPEAFRAQVRQLVRSKGLTVAD